MQYLMYSHGFEMYPHVFAMFLPCSHFQPPSLALSLAAYMSISQNSIYNRQVDKLYLYFIGTESVPVIFLTFRQVIHLGKYTLRQVSLYT